jgi:hypothetical protein
MPTIRTPPCEFANDDTILGNWFLTLASKLRLYSTRTPSLNRAATSPTIAEINQMNRNVVRRYDGTLARRRAPMLLISQSARVSANDRSKQNGPDLWTNAY